MPFKVPGSKFKGGEGDFEPGTLNFERPLSFVDRLERTRIGTDIIRVGPYQAIIGTLLDDVRRPTGDARDDEERRKHSRRDAAKVIGGGAVKIQIREHLFFTAHDLLEALGDRKKASIVLRFTKIFRPGLDDVG